MLLPLLLALTACSGGGDSAPVAAEKITSPVFGSDQQGATYIGADRCLACHDNPSVVGEETYRYSQSYLTSRHGRPGSVDAAADPACLTCHDPLGDGRMLAPRFSGLSLPPAGMAAVGCENCHGAGPEHLAMIPGHPNPGPDFTVCGKCHRDLPAEVAGHRSSSGILEKYQSSAHAGSEVTITLAFCARCHSDEGFRLYGAATAGMDLGQLSAFFIGSAHLPARSPIQCRTCHDGHSGVLRATTTVAKENGLEVVKYSRQFNLCTSCHQVFLKTTFNPATSSYTYTVDPGRTSFHGLRDEQGLPVSGLEGFEGVWVSHFATENGSIPGFQINPASERACVACHDPHSARKLW